MGQAAIKLREIKARAQTAADDYNEKHRHARRGKRPLTEQHKKVLEALVGFVCRGCFHPSYEAIARVARCARSTVGIAIVRLRAAGLLTWSNYWRWNEREGKVTRSVNSYALGAFPKQQSENRLVPQPVSKKKGSGASQVDVGKMRASTDESTAWTAADFTATPSLRAVLEG